ncbi:MAG TPA: SAM-dependent methyltransferase [Streptosporangiaceae bacterium]|nr:SAM-dependent methyltransferase [Streptosporangiaceae bacterium]
MNEDLGWVPAEVDTQRVSIAWVPAEVDTQRVSIARVYDYIPDDEDPGGIVATLLDALAPGSYLAISHGSTDGLPPETAATLQRGYNRAVSDRGTLRPGPQIEAFFDSAELLDPGVVPVSQWRPDRPGALVDVWCLGGVGRKAGSSGD